MAKNQHIKESLPVSLKITPKEHLYRFLDESDDFPGRRWIFSAKSGTKKRARKMVKNTVFGRKSSNFTRKFPKFFKSIKNT